MVICSLGGSVPFHGHDEIVRANTKVTPHARFDRNSLRPNGLLSITRPRDQTGTSYSLTGGRSSSTIPKPSVIASSE